MPGARCTRGLVCKTTKAKNAHEHTGSAETLRHSLRNGFTAYFALSPAIQAFLTPSPSELPSARSGRQDSEDLTPTIEASGPHDLTVRDSIVRQRAVDRSQVPKNPPCHHVSHPDAAASTASRPASLDDPERPSVGQDGGNMR